MNGIIRKLLLSISAFVLIVMIFGTVTFAWFSISATNSIHNMSIDIVGGDEFQISLDGENYFKNITSEMILDSIGNEVELVDVTSSDCITFLRGGPRGYFPSVKNIDYVSVSLWFRTTRAQRTVYLVDNKSETSSFEHSGEGTYLVSRGINWCADATFQNGPDSGDIVNAGERLAFYAAQAIRVGFVEEKVQDNAFDTREDNELKRTIFDLSGNSARGFGVMYGAVDYFNVKTGKGIVPPEVIPQTVYQLTEFERYNPYKPLDENSDILQMIPTGSTDEYGLPYYLGKVTMNIWLEGWDADCLNAILADSIKIQLQFRAGYSYLPEI